MLMYITLYGKLICQMSCVYKERLHQ